MTKPHGWFSVLLLALVLPAPLGAQPAVQEGHPRLRIGGFTDLDFFAADETRAGSSSGFGEGQFVLHFTSALAGRFGFFGEVTLNPRASGFAVEVERTIVRYDPSDLFKVSFGRYHTPINWWNDAFHHGQWLQTSVARPVMTKFGGRFIPVHFVGGLLEGALPSGGLGLHYKAGVGNGRSLVTSRAGDARDSNNNRAWLANLFFKPDRLYGLQVGGAVYRDKVSLVDSPALREWIFAAHAVWTKETPEFIVEFAHIEHEDEELGRTYEGNAVYVQAAYRLPWLGERLKPYFRFEGIDVRPEDPVLQGTVDDLTQYIGGIRLDVADLVALKAEYRRTEEGEDEAKEDVNSLFLQLSLAF